MNYAILVETRMPFAFRLHKYICIYMQLFGAFDLEVGVSLPPSYPTYCLLYYTTILYS